MMSIMKNIGVIGAALALTACSSNLTVNGKTYPTYGLANEDTNKSEDVCYDTSIGNIIVGIILIETVFAPIYVIGWDLFYPTKMKVNGKCGIDADKPKPTATPAA